MKRPLYILVVCLAYGSLAPLCFADSTSTAALMAQTASSTGQLLTDSFPLFLGFIGYTLGFIMLVIFFYGVRQPIARFFRAIMKP